MIERAYTPAPWALAENDRLMQRIAQPDDLRVQRLHLLAVVAGALAALAIAALS